MTEQPETTAVDEQLPDDVAEADDVEPDDNAVAEPFVDDPQQDEDTDGIGIVADVLPATDNADEGTGTDE